MTDESWNRSPNNDTAMARKYASVNGFILPEKYGAYLDGRQSLREDLDKAIERASDYTHQLRLLNDKLDRARAFLTAESLFLAIGHGDQEHQSWLRTELDSWFANKWNAALVPRQNHAAVTNAKQPEPVTHSEQDSKTYTYQKSGENCDECGSYPCGCEATSQMDKKDG